MDFLSYLRGEHERFVCLEMSEETNQRLESWARELGFDLSVGYDGETRNVIDFHMTLFFSKNKVNLPNVDFKTKPYTLEPEKVMYLGEGNNIAVLKLRPTENITRLRQTFEALGLQDNWPSWLPHVSLSYESTPPTIDSNMLPDFPLVANRLVIKKAKD